MTWVLIFLLCSAALNIVSFFYIRFLLKNLKFISETNFGILQALDNYSTHLEGLYELETYYGDQTLQNLLTHSKQIIQEIKLYKEIFSLTLNEDEIGDYFYETSASEEEEKEEV